LSAGDFPDRRCCRGSREAERAPCCCAFSRTVDNPSYTKKQRKLRTGAAPCSQSLSQSAQQLATPDSKIQTKQECGGFVRNVFSYPSVKPKCFPDWETPALRRGHLSKF